MLIPPGNDRTPLVFRGPRGETLVGNLGMPLTLLATRIAGSEILLLLFLAIYFLLT